MNPTRTLAILIFDDVEVLDFCGPFKVFSVANRFTNSPAFNVLTVAESANPVVTRGGLSVNPHHRCTLTGRAVPMAWAFPRRAGHYGRYLTLRDASASEVSEWKSALAWLVGKLSFKHGKPLILKSPGHTCRIRLLLELFPEARFLHIHRNPYDVFRSTQHWMRTGSPVWALQRADFRDLAERTLRQYREVYDAFFEERGLIPKGNFHEISFEALEADRIGQVRGVYDALSLPEFRQVEPTLRRYVESLSGYKKNTLPEFPPDLRERIAGEWRRCFQEWGYPV